MSSALAVHKSVGWLLISVAHWDRTMDGKNRKVQPIRAPEIQSKLWPAPLACLLRSWSGLTSKLTVLSLPAGEKKK